MEQCEQRLLAVSIPYSSGRVLGLERDRVWLLCDTLSQSPTRRGGSSDGRAVESLLTLRMSQSPTRRGGSSDVLAALWAVCGAGRLNPLLVGEGPRTWGHYRRIGIVEIKSQSPTRRGGSSDAYV